MDDAILYFRAHSDTRLPIQIYRHFDGEPGVVLKDLQDFFNAMKKQCFRPSFDDPENVATKYIVWMAPKNSKGPHRPTLDFGGVFITRGVSEDLPPEDPPDHAYTITCSMNPDEIPDVQVHSKEPAAG